MFCNVERVALFANTDTDRPIIHIYIYIYICIASEFASNMILYQLKTQIFHQLAYGAGNRI